MTGLPLTGAVRHHQAMARYPRTPVLPARAISALDQSAHPGFHLTTWYYAIGRSARPTRLPVRVAEHLLLHGAGGPVSRETIPAECCYHDGGLVLAAAVVVVRDATPQYVERGHLSLHALAPAVAGRTLETGAWLWAPLARQLLIDAEAPVFGQIDGLADFLAATSDGVLPLEVAHWLHETPAVIYEQHVATLLAGRSRRPLWDLRTGTAVPAGTPLGAR